MDLAVLDEENVRTGRFGNLPAPVEHQRVGVSLCFGCMFGQRADHVEAGRLGSRGCRARVGPAVFRHVEPDALQLLRGIEVARPLPDRDRAVDAVVLGRNAHHLGAAPRDRADIGIGKALHAQQVAAGIVDLSHRIGNCEAEEAGGLVQALGMLGQLEDLSAIGALALEHGAGIVQPVGQYVNLRLRPFDEFAIHPDVTVKLVERNGCHRCLPRGPRPCFHWTRGAGSPNRIRRTATLCRKRGELKEVPGNQPFAFLFVRIPAERLAKITIEPNLCQQH